MYGKTKCYQCLRTKLKIKNALKRERLKSKKRLRRERIFHSKKSVKKRLWDIFSKFIRLRDKGVCFTCDKKDDWKNTDAGHYIPKTICGEYLYFSEIAVNCQCTGCNRFKHGNLSEYAVRLQRKYGQGILLLLDEEKVVKKPMLVSEMENLILFYEKKVQKMLKS